MEERNKAILQEGCTFLDNGHNEIHIRAGSIVSYSVRCANSIEINHMDGDIIISKSTFNQFFKISEGDE